MLSYYLSDRETIGETLMVCQHVFSGIRLAIGALEREVLTQFVVEAVVLSSFGGLIGIVLALAGPLWLSAVLQVGKDLRVPHVRQCRARLLRGRSSQLSAVFHPLPIRCQYLYS